MHIGKFKGGIFGLFALGLLLISCSGNETIISKGYSGEGTLSYFPLNEGYTTTFEVRSNGTTWLDTYRVGGEKMIQSGMATWRVKSSGGAVDTGYFQGSSDAVFYYPTASSGSEKILQAPLSVGQSWDRYASSGGGGGGGGTGGDGGAETAPGHFPTGGSNVMIVRGTETIYLSNGTIYTSALKISTQEVNGYENRYWFVQGIGLVKYVLAVSGSLATGEGQTVGELVEFGY